MRYPLVILTMVFLCGCLQTQGHTETDGTQVSDTSTVAETAPRYTQHVALMFSDSESDPWVNEVMNTLGAELGTDLWSKPEAGEYFELYGPYDIARENQVLRLEICMVGFTGVGDLAGQEVLGTESLNWLEGINPDVAWLDGDPVQFQVGRFLTADIPVVFSGVVIERRLFYDYERPLTGVYERFSLPMVMGQIWTQDPDATKYALIVDDSPTSAGRAQRFVSFHAAMPEGHEFIVPVAATSWKELKAIVDSYADEVDAYLFCGVGEDGCSADFLDNPCPKDLVVELGKPAIVLGPSRMDHCGVMSLQLKPSVHCQTAFTLVEKVLEGIDPLTIPSVTPEDLGVFISEVDLGG